MFGLAEFAIRLLARYSALAGFVALAALTIAALLVLARTGMRLSATNWGVFALIGIVGMALLAAPAWKAASHLSQVFAAADRAPPAPSGPFTVGDTTLTLTPNAGEAGDPIEVRVWFPRDAETQARRLILYAPGIGGDRNQNALLTADLASHGYVVVGFDDLSQTPAPLGETPAGRALREGAFDFTSRAALDETIRNGDIRADIQARKAIDILNRVSVIANDAATPWGGHVDLARIGFLGYSFGGATAAETAMRDERIVAVANIDGTLFGAAAQSDLRTPYLLILSDMRKFVPLPQRWRRDFEWMLDERELARAEAQALQPQSDVIEVRLAGHAAFADGYFDRANLRGWLKIDPFRAYDIMQSRVLTFFTAYLPVNAAPERPQPERRFEEVLEIGAPA